MRAGWRGSLTVPSPASWRVGGAGAGDLRTGNGKEPTLPASVGSYLAVSGAEGDRTPDPLLAKQVLSQLSYRPVQTAG